MLGKEKPLKFSKIRSGLSSLFPHTREKERQRNCSNRGDLM